MSAGILLFVVCAAICLFGALVTILAKNPIRSAMGLLATIVGIAGLFLRLNAQFLAAMQILVYAGAIVILFVFVIMLLGPDAGTSESHGTASRFSRALSGGLLGLLGLGTLVLLGQGTRHAFAVVGKDHGSVEAVGKRLFVDSLVPFELATALLIVAAIGALAVARTAPSSKKKQVKPLENPTLRMFHGPLVARDSEQPLTGETLAERAQKESGV
ncbi:MAG TPA: NADH-quinone oxidoreductase subunit J [Polyangiaceae bacterium]|nr:NADH-quinone oxidoreductase subunit J [Polyangiaceae bacterium]